MQENITVQIGKCGIQLGHEFWKQISCEHFIDPRGMKCNFNSFKKNECVSNFFREFSNGFYVPRTVLFDLEPREIQNLKGGNFSKFYENADIITRTEGSGNNWSNGYIRALEINQEIEETFRKLSEKCHSVGSFNLFHSITGGTGSGSTCVLLETIKEHFPGKIINCYSVIPNQTGQSDIVVQPYNSVLSTRWLNYYSDCVLLFQNDALNRIIQNNYKTFRINYSHLNSLAAKTISSLTLPMRLWEYTGTNFEGIISSLVPYLNLHFLFGTISDYNISGEKKHVSSSYPENIRSLLKNKTVSFKWDSGKLISSTYFLNKKFFSKLNWKILKKVYQDFDIRFINWISPRIQEIDYNGLNSHQNQIEGDVCIFNHTGIRRIFMKMKNQFDILKKRNAFVTSFLKEFSQRDGQDIFDESRESIEKIISSYNEN